MKFLLFFLAIYLSSCLESSTAKGLYQRLVNQPDLDAYRLTKRSSYEYHAEGVKGRPLLHIPHSSSRHPSLRKGEGLCNGRVCTQQPNEVPEGCNGMCQYRIY